MSTPRVFDGGGREAYSFDIEGQDSREFAGAFASSESARAQSFHACATRDDFCLHVQMRALLYWYIARFATRRWN